ncbi:MAG: TPM domain-containing protein [Lachnospiraceae bacterium]|nr:TPM domain-containing protein [Lachnospiraceae bacterium]
MKKKILAIIAVLAIALCFVVPTFAAGQRLVDDSNLLSIEDAELFSGALDELSEELGVDVVIHTTDSFYGQGAQAYADAFYEQNGYGPDGVELVLNMVDGEFWISTAGEGIQAFTDYGIDLCCDDLVPYLQNDDITGAFKCFVNTAYDYFLQERAGNPVDQIVYPEPVPVEKHIGFTDIILRIVGAFLVAFLISLAITAGMKSQMKSVASQHNANVYVEGDRINLTKSADRYLYNNVVVVPLPQNNNRSGGAGGGRPGGSSVHVSAGGMSHGGGGRRF